MPPPPSRPSADWQEANDRAIAEALAGEEVARNTPSPAKAGATSVETTPSAPPLPLPGDAALAAQAQAGEDAAGAAAFYDTTAAPTAHRTVSDDPCSSDAALAYALQEAEAEAAAAAKQWSGPPPPDASASASPSQPGGTAPARLLASAVAGPWHAVCSAATAARLAGLRLASHAMRPIAAAAAAAADVPAERRRLDRTLAQHSLVERVVTGDGACQFRAVSDQLYGLEAAHGTVRAAAVAQLAACPERYAAFVGGGEGHGAYASYVARMASPREWGDAITLQAIADAYGVRIVVVSSYEPPFIEVVPAGGAGGGVPPRVLYLSFFAEVHYNSVYAAPRAPVAVHGTAGGDDGPWTPERVKRWVVEGR